MISVADAVHAAAVESAALRLPASERARLAERLLSSLEQEARIEQAWSNEIAARVRAYRAGEMPTISVEESFRDVEDLLR